MANQVLYGFLDLEHLFDQRVATVNEQQVFTAIDATIAEHNRQINALMSLFVEDVMSYQIRYEQSAVARLQPGGDKSRALPIIGAASYTVAFPLQQGQTALGITWQARAKITLREVNNRMNTILSADMRWMRDHILAALFTNTTWTFADVAYGNLTIQPLANADTVTYLVQTGADSGATDTHFLAQAGAVADNADPFPTIYAELVEHPENMGDVVAFIPTNIKAAVQGLTSFYPASDANLRTGSAITTLVGDLSAPVPGEVIGYHDSGVWIVEWKSLPDNYIIATTTDGRRPLGMRQEPEAELQGFRRADDRNDYPYYESQYVRIAGFGGLNRVGAVVYRVSNGAYAIPTGYSAPIP